jgi:M6 family metalloprotease-like protein
LNFLKCAALAWVSLWTLSGLTHAGSDRLLEIKGRKLLSSSNESVWKKQDLLLKNHVSKRNLLGLERETPYSLPRLSKLAFSQSKTLRILAVRVEFQEESPDDPQTTGNGLFDMRGPEEFSETEGHLIDPSPHDTSFFQTHIRALHGYWWTVSGGQLSLEGEVFPRSETLAYRLPHPMVHYGAPDSSLSGKVEMLRQFFHDSFNLAESLSMHDDPQVYGIDFSQYDCFVIFHAGSDLQSDLGALVEPTPGDLFSGFIVLGDTVWVNGGTFAITEGTFMPETRSQDNRITALNGLFAHEFGHQLGLPDLYNSRTFTTQVGDFALMDNNVQNVGVDVGFGPFVSGVLPVYPCAWSRAFLGFVEPVEVTNLSDAKLFAAEMETDQLQVIRIPISPKEYFLLENRQADVDGDRFSALRADSATNVILGPVNAQKVPNREYDWLLPGSGILIFHVDEEVAYYDFDFDGLNNFWDNELQVDKDMRFVTLVEADGIVDFGGDYYTGFGRHEDMFRKGNNTALTPYTFPSSRSRNGSDTHVWITDIGFSDTLMTLDVSRGWTQYGFPQKFIPETGVSSLVFAQGDLKTFASSGRFIHAWDAGGAGLFVQPDSVEIMQFDSTLVTLPLAIFAEDDSDFVGPPSIGDLDGDDTLEVVAVTVDGRVHAWHPYDRDQNRRADLVDGFPVALGDRASMIPVIANFDADESDLEIFVGGESGKAMVITHQGLVKYQRDYQRSLVGLAMDEIPGFFFLLTEDEAGARIQKESFFNPPMPPFFVAQIPATSSPSPVSGDLNRDGDLGLVMAGGDGRIYAWDGHLNLLPGFPVETNANTLRAGPVLGDIDGDGYLEITAASGDRIFAYNFNGTPVTNFPVTTSRPGGPTDLIESSPIIGDVDGDGYADIVVGTKNRQILAYNRDGKMVDGFPLPAGGPVTSSPVLMNLDKDADVELLVASDDGFVYAWDLPSAHEEENFPWVMFGHDAGHTNYLPKESMPPVPPLAGDLLPAGMAFNYPNPTENQTQIRYYLKENAEVNIRIYDLSGMLVDEFPGPGVGRTHNEQPWDCSEFASGVYLCRVEAKSDHENQSVIFKMAIVK